MSYISSVSGPSRRGVKAERDKTLDGCSISTLALGLVLTRPKYKDRFYNR